MDFFKVVTALGIPALIAYLLSSYVEHRQSKRPQNILREMLKNRSLIDPIHTRGGATNEVINGLDRLIIEEIDKQLAENRFYRANPRGGTGFPLFVYYVITLSFSITFLLIPLIYPGILDSVLSIFITLIVQLVFTVIFVMGYRQYLKFRMEKRISRLAPPYYNETEIQKTDYYLVKEVGSENCEEEEISNLDKTKSFFKNS